METVFAFRQCQTSFWTKASCINPQNVLHAGVLSLTSASSSPAQTSFRLTRTHLYRCTSEDLSSPCDFEVCLRWCVLLPFEERGNFATRFGFSLYASGTKADFYVKSQEELGQWLDFLEEICVLTDVTDDYTILKQIGSGGQSTVFLGENLITGQKVAIKVFEKRLFAEHPKRVAALAREVDVLRDMAHSRIVKLYRVYEDDESVYLVTEFIPGQELFHSLATKGKFSSEESAKFIEKFLELLDYLQEQKILHRDLKPENILLTNVNDRSEFKLIDFGFAMKFTGTEVIDSCGSPGYIAPEIILDHRHGSSVDIYSAGIIFFVVLAGYSPFYAKSRKEVLTLNAESDISFNQRWEGIDGKYVKMIRSMTCIYPELRKPVKQLKDILTGGYKSERRCSAVELPSQESVKLVKSKLHNEVRAELHSPSLHYV